MESSLSFDKIYVLLATLVGRPVEGYLNLYCLTITL